MAFDELLDRKARESLWSFPSFQSQRFRGDVWSWRRVDLAAMAKKFFSRNARLT
jgi:hypothetical protein